MPPCTRANLFLARLDDEEMVKVLDFGIAKESTGAIGDATKTGEVMGSPHYMSPEQVRAEKDLDYRTDLWSVGVILYRTLVGELPFPGDQIGPVLAQILTNPIPSASRAAPDLPPAIDAFFERALQRDKHQRFQTIGEMVDAFQVLVAGRDSRASFPVSLGAAPPFAVAPSGTPAPAPLAAPAPATAPHPIAPPVGAVSPLAGPAPAPAAMPFSPAPAPAEVQAPPPVQPVFPWDSQAVATVPLGDSGPQAAARQSGPHAAPSQSGPHAAPGQSGPHTAPGQSGSHTAPGQSGPITRTDAGISASGPIAKPRNSGAAIVVAILVLTTAGLVIGVFLALRSPSSSEPSTSAEPAASGGPSAKAAALASPEPSPAITSAPPATSSSASAAPPATVAPVASAHPSGTAPATGPAPSGKPGTPKPTSAPATTPGAAPPTWF